MSHLAAQRAKATLARENILLHTGLPSKRI